MTEESPTERGSTATMQDVDHTHPDTDDTFGTVFTSGQAVAADGGESGPRSGSESNDRSQKQPQTMADVDHDSADEGVDRAYERGTEGRDETV